MDLPPGPSSSMPSFFSPSGSVSGMLVVHLLAGHNLMPQPTGHSPNSPPSGILAPRQPATAPRNMFCVVECDRVVKATTVVRSGDIRFDWDECFDIELVENRQLGFLVCSWDPQHGSKLCYRGYISLLDMMERGPTNQIALVMKPCGTLYINMHHTDPRELFCRRPVSPRLSPPPLFGADVEAVVAREVRGPHDPPVPLIVRRCVEEIERRGLDIRGIYRLCGSTCKKRILREAFEKNSRTVELTPDAVPDINVITGLLKDYLRELPRPFINTRHFQKTVNAVGGCRERNAYLRESILECLPRAAHATLAFLLDHLARVVAAQDRNEMSPQHLAVAMAPPLMIHYYQSPADLDYQEAIYVLHFLLLNVQIISSYK